MKNIVLIGMTGSGKTTIGKALAKELSMAFVDTDELIETKQNTNIKDIFSLYGEDFFRKLESECAKEVSAMKNTVISTGGGIILKEENMKSLHQNSIVVYLKRSVDSIKTTIDSSKRPLVKDDVNKLYEMEKTRAPLYEKYSDFVVENEKSSSNAVHEIIKLLKNNI